MFRHIHGLQIKAGVAHIPYMASVCPKRENDAVIMPMTVVIKSFIMINAISPQLSHSHRERILGCLPEDLTYSNGWPYR